jgi:DNA polymerase-3 subunit delta'
VIMSEADTMNQQAQNAFLKTLEEPHANTMLILTSSNPHRFYPTVLSRCQDVRFDILSRTEIASALVERDELDPVQAEFLSRLSAGSYSQARAMISEDIIEMRKEIVKFLRSALSRSRKTALAEISIFLPKAAGGSFIEKRVAVEQRLLLLTLWLRDALALATNAATFIINNDQREDLDKFVLNFGNPSKIIRAIGAVEKAQGLTRMQLQLRPVMIGLVMDLEAALL